MNFFKWRLKWDDKQGVDPTFLINTGDTRIEPMFANGADNDPSTFYYAKLIKGTIDIDRFSDFAMQEVSSDEVLLQAQKIDRDAVLTDDGIVFPPRKRDLDVSGSQS